MLALSGMLVAGGDIEPVVEPVAEVVATDAWAGPYIGLQAGYNWGDADVSSYWANGDEAFSIDGFDVNGFLGGIFAGYNWRMQNDMIVGIEGEWNHLSA